MIAESENRTYTFRFRIDVANRLHRFLTDHNLQTERGGKTRIVNKAIEEFLERQGY